MPERVAQLSAGIDQLVVQLTEAWNSHDADGVAALCAEDFEGVDVAEAMPLHGREDVRQGAARYLHAFPDLRFVAEEVVVEGDRVAVAWRAQGTHRGPLMKIPATGRTVVIRGASLLTVREGKFVRGLSIWDVAGLLRGLGLLPDL
jgi:steroid delta-isomerase-like uncharacterized protein